METHSGKPDPEPGSLKDSPEFRELAERMKRIPPDRRADVFEDAESPPPELKLFANVTEETTPDDSQCPPGGN